MGYIGLGRLLVINRTPIAWDITHCPYPQVYLGQVLSTRRCELQVGLTLLEGWVKSTSLAIWLVKMHFRVLTSTNAASFLGWLVNAKRSGVIDKMGVSAHNDIISHT